MAYPNGDEKITFDVIDWLQEADTSMLRDVADDLLTTGHKLAAAIRWALEPGNGGKEHALRASLAAWDAVVHG